MKAVQMEPERLCRKGFVVDGVIDGESKDTDSDEVMRARWGEPGEQDEVDGVMEEEGDSWVNIKRADSVLLEAGCGSV